MTERSSNGDHAGEGDKARVREATARLEAAVNELAAVAGERAAQHVERAAARLRARTTRGAPAASAETPAPPRHPLWLWSNKPRTRKLYRAPRNGGEGKLLGVCAGIANLYGLEAFVVRLAVVALFFFLHGAVIVAYVAAAIVMDTEPAAEATTRRNGQDAANSDAAPPAAATREQAPPQASLSAVGTGFAELEQRLRRLEHFVTSDHFHLHREFAKIGDP